MTRISGTSSTDLDALAGEVRSIVGLESVEKVAQEFTKLFFNRFSDSVVLARIFATIPFGKLPPPNQQAVRTLAASACGTLSDTWIGLGSSAGSSAPGHPSPASPAANGTQVRQVRRLCN